MSEPLTDAACVLLDVAGTLAQIALATVWWWL